MGLRRSGGRNVDAYLDRVIAACGLGDGWTPELISDHPNTAAIIYRLSYTAVQRTCALKIARFPHDSKVRAEAAFLRTQMHPAFPRVWSSGRIPGVCSYYLMEFVENATSFSLLFLHDRLTPGHLLRVLDLLETMELRCHPRTAARLCRIHFQDRLTARLGVLAQSYLREWMGSDSLKINGRLCKNLPVFWREHRLHPRSAAICGAYPGDLHFENILLTSTGRLTIVDPKGAGPLPLVYDLGKLLHSIHGGYDLFVRPSRFVLERLHGGVRLRCTFPRRRAELLHWLEREIVRRWGGGVLKAAYLSEIYHFSCLVAHHLHSCREALAFYCRTVQLMRAYEERFAP